VRRIRNLSPNLIEEIGRRANLGLQKNAAILRKILGSAPTRRAVLAGLDQGIRNSPVRD
jgi:hypothetical protein